MAILEQIISIIAPHYCIECGQEGKLLCEMCATEVFDEASTTCAFCGALAPYGEVCAPCKLNTPITHCWALGDYGDTIGRLVRKLKFDHTPEAGRIIADNLARMLPHFAVPPLVVPLPTASSRVRQRGYDQSVMIAKRLARHRHWSWRPVLGRNHQGRQVGKGRAERFHQAAAAYRLKVAVAGPILLVDDIMTTGASLSAAAQLLAGTGASPIMAVVAAKQPLKK